MQKNGRKTNGVSLFNPKNTESPYLAIFLVLAVILSSSLLTHLGFGPGGLIFTLYWLLVVSLIIIFLVVPYFKKLRRKDG